MDEFFDLPTLVVIGIAIVVLFRLRSVLGTRTGNERPPVERSKPDAALETKSDEKVVPLRGRSAESNPAEAEERRGRKLAAEIEQFSQGESAVSQGLEAVSEADPSFMPRSFLEGAKSAYEMIVTAFAQGDRATLRNLLEKDVFDSFQSVIAGREAAGQKVDFTFVGLPKVEIVDASYDKRNVAVTVRFNAEVISATRNQDGTVAEGSTEVQLIADEWTFARNPKSRDPNWKLVATSQLA